MRIPVVSIIVPVFNSSNTIIRCVESILKQTIENWELLLVDNNSSDNCYEIISDLAKGDSRIYALQECKAGVSNARNVGLDSAHGEYICFVDSDDEIEIDYLEQLLKEPQSDLTVCGYFVDVENSENQRINSAAYVCEEVYWNQHRSKSLLIPAFEKGFMHLCCNKLFRRDIIETNNLRFSNYPVNEDYIFTLSFLQYANSISIIDKPLYHWIRVTGEITGVKSIPDNLLDIYNTSHLLSRDFFKDNTIADRIAYFSYEMIIYKYYEAIRNGRMTKKMAFIDLHSFCKNDLVRKAYKAYRPTAKGEKLLYYFMRKGHYKAHYYISQKILS